MKKFLLAMLCVGLSLNTFAQTQETSKDIRKQDNEKLFKNKWFNHVDIAFTGGTSGFGFDLAAPMSDWARLRVGGVFRPIKHYTAKFGTEVAQGLSEEINDQRYNKLSNMMEAFTGYKPQKTVSMQGDLGMNNFKVLVDIYPFKNNRHWYATVGLFWGNNTLIEAKNTPESMNTLTAIAIYNNMYRKALGKENPIDFKAFGFDNVPEMTTYINKLRNWGSKNNDEEGNPIYKERKVKYEYDIEDPLMGTTHITDEKMLKSGEFAEYGISIPLGKYTRDIIAEEDMYYSYSEKLVQELDFQPTADMSNISIDPNADEYHYKKDANGRYIKKGEIRYKKGEVIHHEGDDFYMVPDAENIIRATSVANRFKPYIGIGYETTFCKDKRAKVGIDAGVMIWGGHPSIDIRTPVGTNADGEVTYAHYDLSKDITGMAKSLNSYVTSVRRYPVFPEISARFSFRIF
ncbi:MAG: hypothetical protein KBT34_02340 [Prevotella sp.]|nr:hypothetical protein [Candidatus Prevotella equi]